MTRSGIATRLSRAAMLGIAAILVAVPSAHALSFATEGSPLAAGDAPITAVAQDLNGDGRPDLAVANGTSSDVNIYLRQAGGGFVEEGTALSVGGGFGPSEIVAADFNGDTLPDLAISGFAGSGVYVFLRNVTNTGWTAQAGTPFAVANPGALAVGNFNGDALPDLAVALWSPTNQLRVFLNTGAGFTDEALPATTGTNPRSIAVADFNGDTLPDVAVTSNGSASVSVFLRNGGGGFTEEAGSPITGLGASPQAIRSADFNGDGRPDLAFSSAGPSTETVLLRNAGGGFTNEAFSPFATELAPVGVAPGDLDNDGLIDLAVASQGADNVVTYRRIAPGAFTADPTSPMATGDGATSVSIADFDSDGRRDLAVTNQFADNVSVLLNTTPAPDLGTAPPPPPGVAPDPVTGELPPPTTAKSVNVDTVSGKVLVKVPGSKRFVELGTQERQIPIKSEVDARKGRVEIETAKGTADRRTQQAVFYEGVFQLLQEKKARDAIVEARLTGELENCPKAKKSAVAAKVRGRRLWGKGKGRFRSRGRRSSTTVRGTTWLVEDRCDSTTLNRVTEGTVTVTDFGLKKDIRLKAPDSYIAKPKPAKKKK